MKLLYAKTSILYILIIMLTAIDSRGQSVIQTLNSYLNQAAQDHEFNGNILLAQDGKALCKKSYGYRDIVKQVPLDDSALFPLASISKTFTAVAVLQLMEKGKLTLDDTYSTYFREFPYPAITIRQLLSHTSGLPDADVLFDSLVARNPDKIYTNADVLPVLQYYSKTRSLLFTPGERWSYCSVGYQLLADLVEKLSHEPFAAYLKRHVFMPAGMTSTYVQTSLAQTKGPNRTVDYIYNNHYEMTLQQVDTLPDKKEWTYNMTGGIGPGNVVSTAEDLLHYDRALYAGILLKPSTLKEAFTPVKVNNGQVNEAASSSSYCLGWFIFRDTINGRIVWHSGSAPGVVTLFARNISQKQTYIILTNVALSFHIYKDILAIINHKKIVYRHSLGFLYAQNAYQHGIDYAIARLSVLKSDTVRYILREEDLERAALEFSRDYWHTQNLALETYKIMTLLYPEDPHVYTLYADLLLNGRFKDKDAAILLYKRALQLDPVDEKLRSKLDRLGSTQ